MNFRAIAVFLWSCLVATAAVAGEEHETKIVIKTDDSENGVFEWVSHDTNADFSDLEVGESKTVKGDDGKEVTVTRTEKGLEFDIAGKKIEMLHLGDGESGNITIDVDVDHDGDMKHMIHKMHKDGDVIVNKAHNVKIIKADSADGVTIISTNEIDDATRAKLEKVLKEAGAEGEVMFIDGSELHGDEQAGAHGVHVIKKRVKVDVEVEED